MLVEVAPDDGRAYAQGMRYRWDCKLERGSVRLSVYAHDKLTEAEVKQVVRSRGYSSQTVVSVSLAVVLGRPARPRRVQ